MNKGIVKWFHAGKGFGFIKPNNGGVELFVHHSEINHAGGYATLYEGQQVTYTIGASEHGPCAKDVSVIRSQSKVNC